MYYNQTNNQLLLIYIKKQALLKGLENKHDTTIEWGRTESKKEKKKKTNLEKGISILKNMCGSR